MCFHLRCCAAVHKGVPRFHSRFLSTCDSRRVGCLHAVAHCANTLVGRDVGLCASEHGAWPSTLAAHVLLLHRTRPLQCRRAAGCVAILRPLQHIGLTLFCCAWAHRCRRCIASERGRRLADAPIETDAGCILHRCFGHARRLPRSLPSRPLCPGRLSLCCPHRFEQPTL